tara:strand:- start:730 stop:1584 length:855 start_codon:yes stop_codon:yes gene_type:complete
MSRTIGLIVIGAILLAIVSAFIVSSKFRKDVIASEGEAAVLGLINVKGVIIVLLTGIFGGIFTYIIQLDSENDNNKRQEINQSSAIAFLHQLEGETYTLTDNNGEMNILCNGTTLGKISLDAEMDLSARKSPADWDNWYVGIDGSHMGYVSLNLNQEQMLYSLADAPIFYPHRPYQIGDLDFFFRIDSIYGLQHKGSFKYNYDIRFGEGKGESDITWSENLHQYFKTPDGKININKGLKRIQDSNWDKNYYVAMGLGQPAFDSIKNNFSWVEMVNVVALESKLE